MKKMSEKIGNKPVLVKSFGVAAVMLIMALMLLTALPSGNKLQTAVVTANLSSPDSATAVSVNLGTAANYAILAKTGISTTGVTSIIGDIAVSPAAATYITGFDLIADSSNVFSTSIYVTGKIFAANYATPTPATLTTAISDMATAYTAAAGLAPVATNLGTAGEIGGLTFAPGVYKWSSPVTIASNIHLSGNSTAVWVFQIAQTLDISSNVQVSLSGGAVPRNIFWQVAGQTTLEVGSVFNGNILDASNIAIQTDATLNGRALSQTAVTLEANAITTPLTAPTVSSTSPISDATGVAINSGLSATFSEIMDPSTITNTTFTLMQGSTGVSGTVNYSGITATFKPASNFSVSTSYTATITTGVKDLSENALVSNYVWTFTTGTTADTTAPTINSTLPANTTTGIPLNSVMSAIFSETMDPSTITNTTFTLMQGATSIPSTVTYSVDTAVLTPTSNFVASTIYTATITTGVKDLAGNALANNYVWTFTTGATADTIAPTVSSISPANNATNVAVNSTIVITFSKIMNPATITTATIILKHGATVVLGTVKSAGLTAIFTPTSNLSANINYTITITNGAKDLVGNALATNKVSTFVTVAAPAGFTAGYDVGIVLGVMGQR
jgi:hypothetical protein